MVLALSLIERQHRYHKRKRRKNQVFFGKFMIYLKIFAEALLRKRQRKTLFLALDTTY